MTTAAETSPPRARRRRPELTPAERLRAALTRAEQAT
jgi:hypothetical protein